MFPAIIFNSFSFVYYHFSNSFLAYHFAPETRYIVKLYPALIAACKVSVAAIWLGILRRFEKTDENGQIVA